MPIDKLSPGYIGAKLLKLTLARLESPRALSPVDIKLEVDAAADTEKIATRFGLALPLEMTVTSPSSALRGDVEVRQYFRRVVPSEFSFTPREGGEHLVRVRETAHNRIWGSLVVDVAGDRFTEGSD